MDVNDILVFRWVKCKTLVHGHVYHINLFLSNRQFWNYKLVFSIDSSGYRRKLAGCLLSTHVPVEHFPIVRKYCYTIKKWPSLFGRLVNRLPQTQMLVLLLLRRLLISSVKCCVALTDKWWATDEPLVSLLSSVMHLNVRSWTTPYCHQQWMGYKQSSSNMRLHLEDCHA